MNEFVSLIVNNTIEIVFAILSIMIVRYALPFLTEDVIPWLKEKRIYNLVTQCVQAAQKLAENATIDKKQWVVDALTKKGITVDDTVDMYIESAVKELDIAIGLFDGIFESDSTTNKDEE